MMSKLLKYKAISSLFFLIPFGSLIAWDPEICAAHYPNAVIIDYESVDFSTLHLLKSAYDESAGSRFLYMSESTRTYVKIWSENSPLANNFVVALQCGFYEGLTPPYSVIIDTNNQCRGYLTEEMDTNLGLRLCKNEWGHLCLEDCAKQNERFLTFYEKLLDRSYKTGLYFFDLTPSNLVTDQINYFFIDLESVVNRTQLLAMRTQDKEKFEIILAHQPKDYVDVIKLMMEAL